MNSLAETLRDLLTTNIVCFTYQKINGEVRQAKGTRNLALAERCLGESIAKPKTDRVNENAYFDLKKGAWRSYVPEKLISIDGVVARTDTDFAKKPTSPNEPKRGELPKREIPISGGKPETSKPTAKGMGGGFPIGFGGGMGFGGGIPKEEIHKAIEELDKDIFIPIGTPKDKGNTPMQGISLPIDCITIEDFAKMVAKYVVAELANKFFSNR